MICPHCGKPTHRAPEDLYLTIAKLHLTHRENQIAQAILRNYPEYVSKNLIAKRVWTEEELAAFKMEMFRILGPHISVIRRKLKAKNSIWTIARKEHRGYRFQLAPEIIISRRKIKEIKEAEQKPVRSENSKYN